MSRTEQQVRDAAVDESDLIELPIADLVVALWQSRRRLTKVIGIGLLLSLGLAFLAFLIPNKYSSTAELMPPDSQTFSSARMPNFLAGPVLPNLAGGLLSDRSPGATAIGVLESHVVQDDIINRFDLRRVYHYRLYVDTRKALADRTKFAEDKKTGIISITVTDTDRYRARDIAQAYIDELDRLVSSLSTSSARRERIFLEGRLKSVKADLDDSSRALSQFSSRNATFDPGKQGVATVEAANRLQSELITAESELSGLRAVYSDDNVRVRGLSARIVELQSQLRKIRGEGPSEGGANLEANELFPSVRQIPLLGFTYSDLYRQVTIDESIYETLTKQYEIAKVEEAKEIPLIKVLDAPNVPEKKSGPNRSLIFVVGFLLSVFGGIGWIVASWFWEIADDASLLKRLTKTIMPSLRG